MPQSSIFKNLMRALCSAAAISLLLSACAQEGAPKKRRGGGHRPTQQAIHLPIFQIVKTAGFHVTQLPPSKYVLLTSQVANLPKGWKGKVSAQQTVVLLTYGFKGGGVVRLYETRDVKGIPAKELIKEISAEGWFRDQLHDPHFTSDGFSRAGTAFMTASIFPNVVEPALAIVKSLP